MTDLLLARHGATDWTRDKRWQGHADPPLNERGRNQARALARHLADEPIDVIYASDLRRAATTAAIVAEVVGLEVRHDRGLRENDFGDWTGLTRSQVERLFPDGVRRRKRGLKGWNGGESYDEMAERVVETVLAIVDRHADERVLIVTHNGPIRAIHAHVAGVRYSEYRKSAKSIKKGTVSTVAVNDGVWTGVTAGMRTLPAYVLLALEPLAEWNGLAAAVAL